MKLKHYAMNLKSLMYYFSSNKQVHGLKKSKLQTDKQAKEM